MKIDNEKIFKNFIDIKNIANINLLKCYKSLFTKKGFKKNIGSFIIIPIILFHIICIFIFYCNQQEKIKQKIDDIRFGIINLELYLNIKKEEQKKAKLEERENIMTHNLEKIKRNKFKKKSKIKTKFNKKNNLIIKYSKHPDKDKKSNNALTENNNNIILKDKLDIIQKAKEIMTYKEQELNEMKYKSALKYDKRNFCEHYFSLIKTKHDLILYIMKL